MHAGDLLEHVLKLAQRHAVPVREHCAVSMVERHDAGFKLHISKGDAILARIVVCASGYFKKPFRPELPNDGSVPALHTSEIADHSECYRWGSDGKRVLIVGRRISAGQLLELVSSTGSEVHLSAKGPIDFSREVWWRPAYERLYSIYEPLRLLLEPERQGNSYPAMRGGETRRLIESGQVPLHPPPAAIREGKVEFNDGTWDHFDLLIYATGYSPCLDYLRPLSEGFEGFTIHEVKSLEHHRVPHLYFLGLDNARSFRSRYLRGIRADARWLARRINKHLKSVTQT
jgi:putative flavoprotein involved in K+ transport